MVDLKINENVKIYVDTEPNEKWVERGEKEVIEAKFHYLLNTLKNMGEEMNHFFRKAGENLSTVELQVGFEVNAEGNFIISKVGTKAQIQGKLVWELNKNGS